jgi:hypothetical protein
VAIYVGATAGSAINIADLDVSTLFPGVILAALGTGYLYKLTQSLDAVDHDEVEAVRGHGSLRWIKQRIDSTSATTKILPGTGGNIQLGADGALADDAEAGYMTIPMVGASFDDTSEPTIDEGHAAIVCQDTGSAFRLGVFVAGEGWVWTDALAADA